MLLMRALLAFVALPGVVAFAVPLVLAWPWDGERPFWLLAIGPLVIGAALLLWCAREFYVAGKGTLAPWRPPVRVVTSGPYRLSRNPMYVAVALVLLGWAMGFRSGSLLVYAMAVAAAFHLRVVLGEEPWLARAHREEWRRYAARTPRWIFPNRKSLVVASVALVVAVPIAGLIYEALVEASVAREFPPPGMLVDVGGHRLHLICIGEGEPLVLFEGSAWGTALSASEARAEIARRTTVCSYDRRGSGWSDPGAGESTVGALARELAVLQDRAKLGGPSVIVASSIGGLTAELFTRTFPERVVGLVLLDAASSLTLPLLVERAGRFETAACAARALARVGLVRLFDPFAIVDGTEGGRRAAGMHYSAASWDQSCAMARGLGASQQEFSAAPPLPADMRLTVLTASTSRELLPPVAQRFVDADEVMTKKLQSHQALAKSSTRGNWRTVEDSTHLIGNSQPDAVVEAVFDMLDDIR